ncbi:guanylin family protein [Polypterus senegalus]|uniref:guanylin family protein n=1 Tax=Polypterus senegalus TaxID=55291 RepID=UPI0019651187|nr:guanylin family protein [Polypterus senegalus]
MRVCLVIALCLCTVCLLSNAVVVKDGDLVFSLDSVKTLGTLMAASGGVKRTRMSQGTFSVCTNPALPKEFLPVCESQQSDVIFSRLARIAENPDVCEICAYAACTGC